MDWEAPADAWYVWAGTAMLTVALAGVALSMPTQPPPDAQRATNAIDSVAGNDLGGTATYEHDADMVRIDPQGISMRNDGGTQHATISFDRLAPVYEDEALQSVIYGGHPTDPFADWSAFHDAVRQAESLAEDPNWRVADGTLQVRVVVYDHPAPDIDRNERAILVDAYANE